MLKLRQAVVLRTIYGLQLQVAEPFNRHSKTAEQRIII